MKTRVFLAGALCALASLGLTACGDDDDTGKPTDIYTDKSYEWHVIQVSSPTGDIYNCVVAGNDDGIWCDGD